MVCYGISGVVNGSWANDTFLNSRRKNEVEAQVEFTLKIMKRARVTCY